MDNRSIEGMVISKKIDFLRRGFNLDGELRSSMKNYVRRLGNDIRWIIDRSVDRGYYYFQKI